MLATTHQLTEGATTHPTVTLAQNSYDELGRLSTNKKGNVAGSEATYGYNVRSWMKSISSALFSQDLYYNDAVTAHTYSDYKALYNGNISGMEWQVQNEATRSYRFKYDKLSRITHAAYNGAVSGGMYNSSYAYDKHGNISTLTRRGKNAASGSSNVVIDQLKMTYSGNQMIHVSDGIANFAYSASADFKDKTSTAGTVEYTYNRNGAMKSDLNKGITEIKYNSLNLPQAIEIDNQSIQGRVKYTYSASGVKLRTIHETDRNGQTASIMASAPFSTEVTDIKTTDYAGNIIYEVSDSQVGNTAKMRILVDGGYIEDGVYPQVAS